MWTIPGHLYGNLHEERAFCSCGDTAAIARQYMGMFVIPSSGGWRGPEENEGDAGSLPRQSRLLAGALLWYMP